MKRKLFAALGLLATSVFGQGVVRQTVSQLGTTTSYVIAFNWTGDPTLGTVAVTPAALSNGLSGYFVTQVETVPGTPAPTAGYSVAITDSAGVDIFGGAASSLSAASPQGFPSSCTAPPINGTINLSITGQSVAGARGVVYVFIMPTCQASSAGGSPVVLTSTGPPTNPCPVAGNLDVNMVNGALYSCPTNGGNWVLAAGSAGGTWGSITGTLSAQTDLQTALNTKPTGTLVTTVGSPGSNSNIPTEAAVRSAIGSGNPPGGSATDCQTNNGSGGFAGSANCTIDSSGNTVIAGSLTTGNGSGLLGQWTPTGVTVANLNTTPPAISTGSIREISDGKHACDTSVGSGTFKVLVQWNGSAWVPINGACSVNVMMIPAANCNGTNPGAGWSIGAGGAVTCRAGTNNKGGYITITDTSSTFAQFQITIPEDWVPSVNPWIRFQIASTDTTAAHTIIPSIQISCSVGDGSTTDDVTFNAAHSLSTISTNTTANQFWSTSNVQLNATDMTGCAAGALMTVQVGRATDSNGNARFYSATMTFLRNATAQAN